MKKASQATPHNQQVAIIHTYTTKKSVDGRDSSLATEEEAAKEEKEGTKHCCSTLHSSIAMGAVTDGNKKYV